MKILQLVEINGIVKYNKNQWRDLCDLFKMFEKLKILFLFNIFNLRKINFYIMCGKNELIRKILLLLKILIL